MTNQTTKIDPINRGDEADSELNKAIRLLWCGREDLNLHGLPHYHLKVARLPIPPRPQGCSIPCYITIFYRNIQAEC
jgi:hypothetical protein